MTIQNLNILAGRATIRGWEVRSGIEQFAHVVATITGKKITIQWGYVPTAAVNEWGHMYLANIADDAVMSRAEFVKFVGYVVHEVLHIAYTDFNAHDRRKYVAALHNAVEDAWIERRAIRENLLGNIEWVLHTLLGGMVEQALAEVTDWANPAQYPFALAVFARQYPIPAIPFPAEIRWIFEEATARVGQAQSSKDTLAIAIWVFEQLQEAGEKQDEQEPGQQPDAPQPGKKGGEGEDEQAGAGEGEGEGEGAGEGEGEGSEDGSGSPQNGAGEAQSGEVGGTPPVGPAQAPGPFTAAREVEPHDPNDGESGCYGTFTRDGGMGKPTYSTRNSWDVDLPVPGRLRFELRKIFEKTAREDFDTNLQSGALNLRALHKIGTSDRLFSRRDEEEGIDSAVVIVLDCSGSMSFVNRYTPRPRLETAVPCCAALLRVLSDAGVDTCLMTFGDKTAVIKPFGQGYRAALPMLSKLGDAGDTNDYHAMRVAHEMLLRHRAQRRIVLSITDGEGQVDETRAQVISAANLGIQTIGIGIGYDVSKVYPVSVRVESLADLGTVAFSKLRAAA